MRNNFEYLVSIVIFCWANTHFESMPGSRLRMPHGLTKDEQQHLREDREAFMVSEKKEEKNRRAEEHQRRMEAIRDMSASELKIWNDAKMNVYYTECTHKSRGKKESDDRAKTRFTPWKRRALKRYSWYLWYIASGGELTPTFYPAFPVNPTGIQKRLDENRLRQHEYVVTRIGRVLNDMSNNVIRDITCIQ
jgi:hypothetical protein